MTKFFAAAAVAALLAGSAHATTIAWTDWTSLTPTLASGTIGSTTVSIDGPFDYSQVSGGTDYWHSSGTTPWAAYDALGSEPSNNDEIAPSGNGVLHTITFGSAVTNPYVEIISLGQPSINTTWDFSVPFTLIDQGQGYWGNGPLTIVGNQISAGEGHGIIRLSGTFTSFTLLTNNTENWSGLTFGLAVPEPATWALMIAGFGMVGVAARRRKSALAA